MPEAGSIPMTIQESPIGAESKSSPLATTALWLWRLANTGLLAAGVWVLWHQLAQLETLNGELINLIDYLSVIAERLN